LVEFSYNNSYQASLKMAPFDALYERRCRTPLNWSEAGERTLFGPDLVKDAEEKVQVVDAKCAPSAKHTASRTSWLYTRKGSQDVPVNFS
jgi:hypothetical protein